MRRRLVFLLVLTAVMATISARAEVVNPSLDRLISLGEVPLERVADIGGIIAAKPMDFADSTGYLKTVVPPTVFPFQKSTMHDVLLVNLSLDIVHPDYYLCFFNPKDIVVHRGAIASIRVVYKNPKKHGDGIWIHLTVPPLESSQTSVAPSGSVK